MLYSCERQNADGSWFYGEAPKFHWIDCFHTGYNLDNLKRYIDSTNDIEFAEHLSRGYEYFRDNFLEADGRTKYARPHAADRHPVCCAGDRYAIIFLGSDPDALDLANRVARWTITQMQAPEGYFCYRDLGWTKIRASMFQWGQGRMFKALAHLLGQLSLDRRPSVAASIGGTE
jgi:hypothetical protein